MAKHIAVIALAMLLLMGMQVVGLASANTAAQVHNSATIRPAATEAPSEDFSLAMPEEWVNYTVTTINGALWAVVDGLYPMHLSPEVTPLPMVYPTPPNTTDMQIRLDGAEVAWSNFTDIEPTARHYTVIGDWQMVYCTIEPTNADFVLQIHYQHPIEIINGSSMFLYDLNISPYLSPADPTSIAYFRVELPKNESALNVYTTVEWKPVNYTSIENGTCRVVMFDVVSVYDVPLAGDIMFVLSGSGVPELSVWVFGAAFAVVTVTVAVGFTRRRAESKVVCMRKN